MANVLTVVYPNDFLLSAALAIHMPLFTFLEQLIFFKLTKNCIFEMVSGCFSFYHISNDKLCMFNYKLKKKCVPN